MACSWDSLGRAGNRAVVMGRRRGGASQPIKCRTRLFRSTSIAADAAHISRESNAASTSNAVGQRGLTGSYALRR